MLATVVVWMAPLSDSGIHRALRRLGLRYRRGQEHLWSPDPDYQAKVQALRDAYRDAQQNPRRQVLVYLDELTYYRRASVGRCYQPVGGPGAYAEQGHARNKTRRIIGALDAVTGQWHYWQGEKAGVKELSRFFRTLAQAYPDADTVTVALDNWSVHFLPDVLASLDGTPIRLLRLPTYAPWTNPTEKVWRKLKQEVIHQHAFGDDWKGLQAAVGDWLARAAQDGPELLRYTGVHPRPPRPPRRRKRRRRVKLK